VFPLLRTACESAKIRNRVHLWKRMLKAGNGDIRNKWKQIGIIENN
jgi:hypothetical protein